MTLSMTQAERLFETLAADPHQSFRTGILCGPRSSLMLTDMMLAGVSPADLGQAALFAPAKIGYRNAAARPLMNSKPMEDGFSFRSVALKLHGLSAEADPQTSLDVPAGDYRFRSSVLFGQPWITILDKGGQPLLDPYRKDGAATRPDPLTYMLQDHGSISGWAVHIAPTVALGKDRRVILDPFTARGPVSPAQWKKLQNCPTAAMTLTDAAGTAQYAPVQDPVLDQKAEYSLRNAALLMQIDRKVPLWQERVIARMGGGDTNRLEFDPQAAPDRAQLEVARTRQREALAPLVAFETWRKSFDPNPAPGLAQSIIPRGMPQLHRRLPGPC